MTLQPVILCGGSGARLWPMSREHYPKQLLKLTGEHTMLQATALRLGDVATPPILVGNEEYRFLIAEQLRQVGIPHATLLLEPCGRNTAPALTLAALAATAASAARAGDADPVLVVMPADHVIQDETAFREAIMRGAQLAERGLLVTFGITPDAPETGYGYIRIGQPLEAGAHQVDRFVEKPDLATAQAYLASGDYLWNGGIFAFRASVWLAKMQQCRPDILAACRKAFEGAQHDADFVRPDKAAFAACPADSIDYAVLEKLASEQANSGEVAVVPLAARWSDVGAWNALWDIGDKDADGNVLMGDVLAVATHNTLAISANRLIACVGLQDVVVVETPDAILVAHKDSIQMVKEVVTRLNHEGRSESHAHRKVYRPWGWYDSIDVGARFQVKRIVVSPGASLSLQLHHHRAEHWIVVSGTARVTRGEDVFLVGENESTFIPLGTKHRLENPGKVALEMIEVQSGAYLGEDDIVRFEDNYGR